MRRTDAGEQAKLRRSTGRQVVGARQIPGQITHRGALEQNPFLYGVAGVFARSGRGRCGLARFSAASASM